jgi:hypothetical protein
MNAYERNSRKNIFLLSEEKEDFILALREWHFTGEILTDIDAEMICELCEHKDLKYQYQIVNKIENSLLVGSSCIAKFDIYVQDEEGKEVTEHKEAYLIKQAKKKYIKDKLAKLTLTKPSGKIIGTREPNIGKEYHKVNLDESCKQWHEGGEKLDARILNYLFMRFEEEGISYEKGSFEISLKGNDAKNKLLSLRDYQYERIKGSLTTQQRKYYEENKK